jgi:prepilin-type N-terminal cleavage/methylation domain-containing protein
MRDTMNRNKQSGFTLIEVTMVIFILGLLIAPVVFFSPKFIDAYRADLTRIKSDRVMMAYSSFMQKNLRLPCVSWPQVSSDSPIIGAERNLMSPANWDEGCQNTNSPGMTAFATGHNVGVVPWRALGIPENYIMDGWARPFQVRADPKSSLPVANPSTWALYNDDFHIVYQDTNAQIPGGCNTADWWNTNYKAADRTEYDMDPGGRDNSGTNKTWLDVRRMSHLNMPKGRLCCGANWARDFIERYDPGNSINGWPWGQDMSWQRYELSTTQYGDSTGDSQHDHAANIYDWAQNWMGRYATGLFGTALQSNNTVVRGMEWGHWYQNNRVRVGDSGPGPSGTWALYAGQPHSVGPAQVDQPIFNTEPLAVTLISAGPNGLGFQVFDYDGTGTCTFAQCYGGKVVSYSRAEDGNGITYGLWYSSNLGITSIRNPFDPTIMSGENVAFDDMVFYSKTDDLMATAGRNTCARP